MGRGPDGSAWKWGANMNTDNLLLWLDRALALALVAVIMYMFLLFMTAVNADLIAWKHRQEIYQQIELQERYDEMKRGQ